MTEVETEEVVMNDINTMTLGEAEYFMSMLPPKVLFIMFICQQ